MTTSTTSITSTPPTEPSVVTVDSLILAAGAAEGTMYAKARDAAQLAGSELDQGIASVKDRIAAVMAKHNDAFSKVGHNVKAIFSDTLWIIAAAQTKVEVPVAGAPKDKPQTATVPASDALMMSKNVLRDVAKQVREQNGASTNRTGRTAAGTATVVPASNINTFFDDLKLKIADPGEFAKVVAVLESCGYMVTKRDAAILPAAATPVPGVHNLGAQLIAAAEKGKPRDKRDSAK